MASATASAEGWSTSSPLDSWITKPGMPATRVVTIGRPAGNGPALPELHRRLKWVALAAGIVLVLFVGRLYQLQIIRGEGYR